MCLLLSTVVQTCILASQVLLRGIDVTYVLDQNCASRLYTLASGDDFTEFLLGQDITFYAYLLKDKQENSF